MNFTCLHFRKTCDTDLGHDARRKNREDPSAQLCPLYTNRRQPQGANSLFGPATNTKDRPRPYIPGLVIL